MGTFPGLKGTPGARYARGYGHVRGQVGTMDDSMSRWNVLWATKLQGCTCVPGIVKHPASTPDLPQWTVAHDDWCPLYMHGSQIILMNRKTRRRFN